MRVAIVSEMGGYDPTLIAGEEIDLCLRLRKAGHRVWRLDADMVLHDVAMTRLSQWWRRQVRAGHAYAELAWRQRQYREAYWVRRLASILAWGLGPLLLAGLGLLLHPLLVAASLMAYPILWLRVYRARSRGGDAPGDAALLALGITIGKLAQLQGVVGFVWKRRIFKGSHRLIEYK
jgi:GT2 family glycosyltransferase